MTKAMVLTADEMEALSNALFSENSIDGVIQDSGVSDPGLAKKHISDWKDLIRQQINHRRHGEWLRNHMTQFLRRTASATTSQ